MLETQEERRARQAEEEQEAHLRWRRRWRTKGLYGPGFTAAAGFLLLLLYGLHRMGDRVELDARRSELRDHLGALTAALHSFEAENGYYPNVGGPAEGWEAVEAGRPYAPPALGVRTEGLHGVYWVVGGDDTFEAHGLLDADGDGFPAHWVATEAMAPKPLTDDGVY